MIDTPDRPCSVADLIAELDPDGSIRAGHKAGADDLSAPALSSEHPYRDDLPPLHKRVERARRYLAKKPGGDQGNNGSKPTFDAARDLIRGFLLDPDTALGLLLSEFNHKCNPPWTIPQLQHKIEDAQAKPYSKPPGYLLKRREPLSASPAVPPGSATPPNTPTAPTANPSPASTPAQTPNKYEVNEADDDPARLARIVIDTHRLGTQKTLVFWNGEFHDWDGVKYRTIPIEVFRPMVSNLIDEELSRINAIQVAAHVANKSDGDLPQKKKPASGLTTSTVQQVQGKTLERFAQDSPAWIRGSTGPDPREIVATKTGLIHLPLYAAGDAKAITPNTPEYLNFNATSFSADRAAPEPKAWITFLSQIWPGDPDSIALMQEWFGYLLTPDMRQQKMLLLLGPPRSGKGTIFRVLQELIGQENCANPTLGSLGNEFGLESLVGKSVAVIEDARLSKRTDSAIVTERLLTISGGGRIDVNRKHRAHFSGRLNVRFVVATNEMPDLSDASGALASRWCLLHLRQSFLGREDETLIDRLLAELPGIFNWAVDGWKRLVEKRRFTAPESSADLIADLHDSSSPVGEFVRNRCVVGPGEKVEVDDLYQAWKSWCEKSGKKEPGTLVQFGRQLRAVCHSIIKSRPTIGEPGNRSRVILYKGIGLRDSFGEDDILSHEKHLYADEIGVDRQSGPVGALGIGTWIGKGDDVSTNADKELTESGSLGIGNFPPIASEGEKLENSPDSNAIGNYRSIPRPTDPGRPLRRDEVEL